MKIEGKVWKFGDNIDTDVIIPARFLNISDKKLLAMNCFADLRPDFSKGVGPGDILVGGSNFGCGSSREHAPLAIKESGIGAIIAKSYARIFYRNAFNIGLPILESKEAVDSIEEGDRISVDLTIDEILMKILHEEGVDTIFGFPGGAVLDIYDQLVKTDIRHILVRHEQGAIHAADGYARASGKVGGCLVTSGPGATNTVTGIASAYMDSVPIVVLTGQVNTRLIGNDAFQEVDIVGITRPCTKHNYLVRDIGELANVVKEAFTIARSGRPGPVLVDLPKDVMQSFADYKPIGEVRLKSYQPTYEPNVKQLERLVGLIKKAEKPLIFAGGGTILSGASKELLQFAKKIHAPVTASLMGLGAFPASDPLWLGMIGMHGKNCAHMSPAECDLLIGIGVRFDDRVTGKVSTFASKAKVVHIDIDPPSIGKG